MHNELIKTLNASRAAHARPDYNDYPEGKAPYAMRWPNFYCKRAHELVAVLSDARFDGNKITAALIGKE
jgi:hypothetical protein